MSFVRLYCMIDVTYFVILHRIDHLGKDIK